MFLYEKDGQLRVDFNTVLPKSDSDVELDKHDDIVHAFIGNKDAGGHTKHLKAIVLDTTSVKTRYAVGDKFDASGLIVTARYDDNTTEPVTSGYTLSVETGTELTSAGTLPITISYTIEDITKSAKFTIKVSE